MDEKYEEIFCYILSLDEDCANDILNSVQRVRVSLAATMDELKQEIWIATESNEFDITGQIATYCKQLAKIEKEVEDASLALQANIANKNQKDSNKDGRASHLQSAILKTDGMDDLLEEEFL